MNNFRFNAQDRILWLDTVKPSPWSQTFPASTGDYNEWQKSLEAYNNRLHYSVSPELADQLKHDEVIGEDRFDLERQFWEGTAWWPIKHLVDGKVKEGTKTRIIAIPLPEAKTEFEKDMDNIGKELFVRYSWSFIVFKV